MLNERTADFTTSCEHCIFLKEGRCELGRHEKFRERGVKVENLIVHTFCNTCRGIEWQQDNVGIDLKEKVLRESAIKLDFIIVDNTEYDEWAVLDNLESSYNDIANEKYVNSIIFVSCNGQIKNPKWFEENCNFPYKLVVMNTKDFLKGVDEGVRHSTGNYYCVVVNGAGLPCNLSEHLNHSINEELIQVVMVKSSESISGTVIQTGLHKLLSGNFGMPLTDKIVELAKQQNNEKLIKTWNSLNYPE